MTTDHDLPSSPRGLSRLFYRLPILIFRSGLGWLLGQRFLLLEHIGRQSGMKRHAVLEVIRADAVQGHYFVVAAFGRRSDWLQNIEKSPSVAITLGRRRRPARAEILDLQAAEAELLDYARRHPRLLRFLVRTLGFQIEGTEREVRRLARYLPVVMFNLVENIPEQASG